MNTPVTEDAKSLAQAVVAKLKRGGEGGHYRASEIEALALQLGYLRRHPHLNGAEWLASQLATVGLMPAGRSSVLDPNSAPLTFRDGSVVAQSPGADYVAEYVNELLHPGVIRVLAGPFDPEKLAELKGSFRNGYTEEDVRRVCNRLRQVTGVSLAIVWDHIDGYGYGGNSDYAVLYRGEPRAIESGFGELLAFLDGEGPCPNLLDLILGKAFETEEGDGCNYAAGNADEDDDSIESNPFAPEKLADLAGVFRHGFTDDRARGVLGRLQRTTGIALAIVWGFMGPGGFDGSSEYAVLVNGRPHEIASGDAGLIAFLTGDGPCPDQIRLIPGKAISTACGGGCMFAVAMA
jgi:hypothetical protein